MALEGDYLQALFHLDVTCGTTTSTNEHFQGALPLRFPQIDSQLERDGPGDENTFLRTHRWLPENSLPRPYRFPDCFLWFQPGKGLR